MQPVDYAILFLVWLGTLLAVLLLGYRAGRRHGADLLAAAHATCIRLHFLLRTVQHEHHHQEVVDPSDWWKDTSQRKD